MQAEEASSRDDKTCCKNEKKKSITVIVNIKWCSQDKTIDKKNSVIHKKGAYNDAINKYLLKIDDQRRKLFILREEVIKNYKYLKKSYTN